MNLICKLDLEGVFYSNQIRIAFQTKDCKQCNNRVLPFMSMQEMSYLRSMILQASMIKESTNLLA